MKSVRARKPFGSPCVAAPGRRFIRFGDNNRVNLLLDVFNIFDRQKPITLDERYNLALHGRCSAGNMPTEM